VQHTNTMRLLVVLVIALSLVGSIQAVNIAARRRLEARRAEITERISLSDARRKAIAATDCAGLVADFKKGCSGDASDNSKCGTSLTGKQWDGSSDKTKGYTALSKGPAHCILGGGKEITRFCGSLAGSKAPQCVGSDGKGYNRLTLWGGDWNICVNYQWVHCAANGKLPHQDGATFIFPGVVPSGMTNPSDPGASPDPSVTMLEFCALNELCTNGAELFTIAIMADASKPWTCKTKQGAFATAVNKFTNWLKGLVGSPHTQA